MKCHDKTEVSRCHQQCRHSLKQLLAKRKTDYTTLHWIHINTHCYSKHLIQIKELWHAFHMNTHWKTTYHLLTSGDQNWKQKHEMDSAHPNGCMQCRNDGWGLVHLALPCIPYSDRIWIFFFFFRLHSHLHSNA